MSFHYWRVDGSGSFVDVCSTSFPFGVSSIAYDSTRDHVYLGLVSGAIHILAGVVGGSSVGGGQNRGPSSTVSNQIVPYKVLDAHTGRVTALSYCPSRDIVVSISRDKHLAIYSCKRECIIHKDLWAQAWSTIQSAHCGLGSFSGA